MRIDIWKQAYLLWGSNLIPWEDIYDLFRKINSSAQFWKDENELADKGFIEFYNSSYQQTKTSVEYIKISERIMDCE